MWHVGVAGSIAARGREASVLILLFTTPLLWGCGTSESSAAEAAEPSGWEDLDACQVLTRDEVHEVVGSIVRDPELTADADGATRCVWMAQLGPRSATLFVGLEPDPVPPDRESLADEADGGVEFVRGLGTAAVWDPELADLHVWAFGQKLQIGNPGISREQAVQLAERALAHMGGR